jgi:16S rRNA (cytidine1402-2'-O)-methyltransferase
MSDKMTKGKLYLIPTLLGDSAPEDVMPHATIQLMHSLDFFIVEQVRTARRFLSKTGIARPIDDITFFELNKHTNTLELQTYLQPALQGHHMGLMSEAGTPCIADPGAVIVEMAQDAGIKVVPLTGPNSILLALMASGLNGQQFAFHGYLPIPAAERSKSIKMLERLSQTQNQTQIFIETPFRNNQLLEALLQNCSPETRLCVAANITLPGESIITRSIAQWKKHQMNLHKKPAVFLIGQKKATNS